MNSLQPTSLKLLAFVSIILFQGTAFSQGTSLERNYDEQTGWLTLVVTPDAGTSVYAVEEQLPDGLSARLVSDGGTYDRFLNKLKWGPFLDDQPRELKCELVIVDQAPATFSGSVSVDGNPAQAATGDDSGIVPASGFHSWILAELGQEAFFATVSNTLDDSDGDQAVLLEEYVFGMNPSAPDARFLDLEFNPHANEVELEMRIREDTANVRMSFLESHNLATWTAFDPGEKELLEIFPGDIQAVQYTWPSEAVQKYVRLRLELEEDEN